MIAINLLPAAYQKPTPSPIRQLHRAPLTFLVVGTLVGLWLVLTGIMAWRRAQLGRLTARVQQLAPQKRVVDTLTASLQGLREHQAIYQRLNQARSDWARRLNAISDALPDALWLTDLWFDPEKGLILDGAAVGQGGDEMVHVGKLVQALKADPLFVRTVRDIQIESIKRVPEGELDVVQFRLLGELPPTPGKAKP